MAKNVAKSTTDDDNAEGVWAASGFAIVLIAIGLPIWWYTTTVYRANLPYSTIDHLSSQLKYQTIHLELVGDQQNKIENEMNDIFDSEDPSVRFSISGRSFSPEEINIINTSSALEELDQKLPLSNNIKSGTLLVYFVKQSNFFTEHSIFVSTKRMVIAQDHTDIKEITNILSSMVFDSLAKEKLLYRDLKIQSENREVLHQSMRQVPTEPGYDITLTLMLPQPHITMTHWDASTTIREYLNPIVEQVSDVLDLRIRSQVLYMHMLRVSPRFESAANYYALPHNQLPLTINHIEPKLGSFVSTRPALHFIVYVPCDHQSPLQIVDAKNQALVSNSFLVPRWGGVLIHNYPNTLTGNEKDVKVQNGSALPTYFDLDDHWVMQTIISQLYKLFPVPSINATKNVTIKVSQRRDGLLTDWQLDGLARARLLNYLSNIKITLQSLCELVGEISNMVVSDEVSAWVMSAVDLWDDCLQAARQGRLIEATKSCTLSFAHSDAAFFHPSMLALLYFPDNQKYAIYVPLFLPVSIPVILSLKMIYKMLTGKNKKAKED